MVPSSSQASPAADTNAIDAAIASTDRPESDRQQDEYRKPAAVLQLLGARPGMHAIDVFSAGGYFTELLSRVAGPQGSVIAYNNKALRGLRAQGDRQTYYPDHRLANVQQSGN